jgi:hypothetical protein
MLLDTDGFRFQTRLPDTRNLTPETLFTYWHNCCANRRHFLKARSLKKLSFLFVIIAAGHERQIPH